MRGILLSFFASGALHEYIFAVATLRPRGYQIAFFMLHGLAVAATARLRPRGKAAVLAVAATQAFLIATLVLFTAGMDLVLRDLVWVYPRGGPLS